MILFRKSLPVLFLLLSPVFALAQGLDNLNQYKLDNGLTVILNEDHTRTEVFGYVVCKAGSKDDPADATGMAHYMEHLLFKGTETMGTTDWEKEKPHIDSIFVLYDQLGMTEDEEARKAIQLLINEQSVFANEYAIPNELDNILKELGSTGMNANTTADRTVYFNTFPPNQIERWIEVYAHRFQNAVFRSFQAELEVVYEEKNKGSEAFIRNLIEKFLESSFDSHPYGQQTTIGTIDHLKNPSLTKMKEFYLNWYVPNNMALVICGDFNAEEIKPLIEKAFGSWEKRETPEHGTWPVEPFDGRKFVETRMSPVKLGVLGFRTVPAGHPDERALEVCNNLLSNQSQSGLLDQLSVEHKLLAAQSVPMPYYDHGLQLFVCVPKIVGQSLDEAESLVRATLDSLKQGKFDDWRMDAVKKELYRNHLSSLETNGYRGVQLGEAFARGDDPTNLRNYSKNINKVTREDVLRVANLYYGDNFLALYSKMGSFKGEKIDKPDYEPVVSKTTARSAFAKSLDEIAEKEFQPTFIDFQKDVTSAKVKDGVTLYRCQNPVNDVYSLDIRIDAGLHEIPNLRYIISLMDLAFTEDYSKVEIKNEMSKIGASYYFDVDDSYTYLSLTGLESDLENALRLMNELLSNPQMDEKETKSLIDYEKTERKFENAEPASVAGAAVDFVQYGPKSSYLDRLTLKEVQKLAIADSLDEFKKLRRYSVELHYVGKRSMKDLQSVFAKHLTFDDDLITPDLLYVKSVRSFDANEVYFVHKKNAVQSQVHFLQSGKIIEQSEIPDLQAFNLYFGGGFSGLVLQEIREYRSLAYTAGARYGFPERKDTPVNFKGYIGTQADKTDEAISVYVDLINDMPDKVDRIDMIRKYCVFSAIAKQPGFRGTISYVLELQKLGFSTPPAKLFQEDYKSLTYHDIRSFYEQNVQKKPMVIVIVGDKKKVDTKQLAKYGAFTAIKEKKLCSK